MSSYQYIDYGPDPDIDAPMKTGWCCACECNVDVVKEDHGIGSFEYWGSREVHIDIQDTCTVCGGTDIEEEHLEEETEE